MAPRFERFLILADMRTGSNALEEKLNDFEGVTCHGEVFNPHFIGHSGHSSLFGMSITDRDAKPAAMIEALDRETKGLAGFRLFSDHDRRAFELCMRDRKCAKIVLTRNPLDSYVSLKIARKTGQWWLGDLKTVKPGKAHFDLVEFEQFLTTRDSWLTDIRRTLQETGQAGFAFRYDDLGDDAAIAGLARFLGSTGKRSESTRKGRIQNPGPLSEKVANFAEMKQKLRDIDLFDLDAIPDFEPARGPNVPGFLAAANAGLLYMPIRCAEDQTVIQWLAALNGSEVGGLDKGFTQKSLRQWKRRAGAHLTFTVVAHPLKRAHDAFCRFILPTSPEGFSGIREVLARTYNVPLPDDPDDPEYGPDEHRAAFLKFLGFLKGNLGGQTSIRVDGAWASQEVCLRGFADFSTPDAVLRATRLEDELSLLARRLDLDPPDLQPVKSASRFSLDEIYDARLERAARAAYQRDYMMFGFGAWRD